MSRKLRSNSRPMEAENLLSPANKESILVTG
jgi:hypothetical protein